MKTKLSPAAVGMFILGALLLAVVGFLSFGGTNFFAKPSRFLVYFDESVSGLDPGAAVKVNGVRVGRVAAITVRYDAATRQSHVQTICEIDRNVLTDPAGREIDLTDAAVLQGLVARGLRARLNIMGITGLLFVELDFEDPQEYPPGRVEPGAAYPVVPAIPSPISEVQQSVIEIVADLKRVDFAGLSRELRALLATTSRKVGELDLAALAERVGRAADAVGQLAGAPEARVAFGNVNAAAAEARAALAELRTVLGHVDGQIGPAGAALQQTLANAQAALQSLDGAAQTTRDFVQAQAGLGDETRRALQAIAAAADALERLAAFVERNPNALVVGRKPAPGAARP